MARKMNPDKPGVMIYFSQIRGLTKRMDNDQKARLLDAIVDYAERGILPNFSDDPLLDTAFYGAFALSIERDDEKFTEKSFNRKYSNYVRWSERDRAYVVSREEWRAAGCPPFSEIKKRLIQMDTSGVKWIQMDFFYSVWNTISEPISQTISHSPPTSESASEPTSGADASEPPVGGGPTDPDPDAAERKESSVENADERTKPYEKPTLEQVKRYCRQNDLRDVDPVRYYDYCCANGWTMRGGRRIYDWRAHIRTWNEGDRKRNGTASDGDGDNYGYSDEVAKYVRERMEKRKKRNAAQGSGKAESDETDGGQTRRT